MSGVFDRAAIAGTTRGSINEIELYEKTNGERENGPFERKDETKKKTQLLRRLSSVRSALRPNFGKMSVRFKRISCLRRGDDEEDNVPFVDIPRHKSIDIGVGLARRMSLFIFTKRTTCVHPYHPYYPKTTSRKIYVFHEEK